MLACPTVPDLAVENLRRADFTGGIFRAADLRDANLGGATLKGADLGGVPLSGANLTDADLAGAKYLDLDRFITELDPTKRNEFSIPKGTFSTRCPGRDWPSSTCPRRNWRSFAGKLAGLNYGEPGSKAVFGVRMEVELVNDGPVTITLG